MPRNIYNEEKLVDLHVIAPFALAQSQLVLKTSGADDGYMEGAPS